MLPLACFPQAESKGTSNYTLRACEGKLVCEVQLANRCFRAKKTIIEWPEGVYKTISWYGRDPAKAWVEYTLKAEWPRE